MKEQKGFGKRLVIAIFLQLGLLASKACVCHTEPLTEAKLSTFKNILVARIISLTDTVTNDKYLSNWQIAKIEPLEIFKGSNIKKVLITSVKRSCDLGIRADDVWVFFLNDLNGLPTVLPCGYNTAYLSEKYQDVFCGNLFKRSWDSFFFTKLFQ